MFDIRHQYFPIPIFFNDSVDIIRYRRYKSPRELMGRVAPLSLSLSLSMVHASCSMFSDSFRALQRAPEALKASLLRQQVKWVHLRIVHCPQRVLQTGPSTENHNWNHWDTRAKSHNSRRMPFIVKNSNMYLSPKKLLLNYDVYKKQGTPWKLPTLRFLTSRIDFST